jgi:hypothetical protein
MISAIMEAEPFGEFLNFLQISPKAFAIPEYGASLLFKAYFPSTNQPVSIPSAPFSRVLARDDFPTPLCPLIKMSSLGEWEWTRREGEENYVVGASVMWSSFLAIIRSKQDFNVAISRSLPIKPTDSMSNLFIVSLSKLLLLICRREDRLISFSSDFLGATVRSSWIERILKLRLVKIQHWLQIGELEMKSYRIALHHHIQLSFR